MKKIFLFTIALFIINTAYSQVYIGQRIGINMATTSGKWSESSDTEYSSLIGFQLGIVFDIHFSDMISLQTELLYAQNGTKYKYSNTDNNTSMTTIGRDRYNNS